MVRLTLHGQSEMTRIYARASVYTSESITLLSYFQIENAIFRDVSNIFLPEVTHSGTTRIAIRDASSYVVSSSPVSDLLCTCD